ncbi:hypothetical protein CH278_00705 [Rhodococcus sp. 05-2254-5]|uniref:hypothetical protein n=1 Tax=Nocardiaceae TaxID=85025 RepID=UPI00050C108D|nr:MULTISPECIES: hypothetical protein [Rhodococcus]OZE18708.1 hypothetical protein CH256_26260 [Rhodococcus sp. 05-2254-6]OZE39785.1 hypothetical protein CH278_00705 [Rhodococcus sp. 05-2254-5]OZE60920.1 hypothetical protein CH269_04655 [Rhodococcus sp. 05-2254-1]OZE97180.1 hypothetical protein CH300_27000 [Rhodococcus sp. 15-1154-1]OZE97832.1 hypothetical protein CH302_13535 [Rhodococcus sp. 15-2388-1-1a]
MTDQADQSDAALIDEAIERLEAAAGRTPSVLTLARHLGLANTTFRRRYPDIVDRLRASGPASTAPAVDPLKVDSDIVRLRQRNRQLTDDLTLAMSSIQRLSIDNRSLRRQLDAAAAVTHLPRRGDEIGF